MFSLSALAYWLRVKLRVRVHTQSAWMKRVNVLEQKPFHSHRPSRGGGWSWFHTGVDSPEAEQMETGFFLTNTALNGLVACKTRWLKVFSFHSCFGCLSDGCKCKRILSLRFLPKFTYFFRWLCMPYKMHSSCDLCFIKIVWKRCLTLHREREKDTSCNKTLLLVVERWNSRVKAWLHLRSPFFVQSRLNPPLPSLPSR